MSAVEDLAGKAWHEMETRAQEMRDLADALEEISFNYKPGRKLAAVIELARKRGYFAATSFAVDERYATVGVCMRSIIDAIEACNQAEAEAREAQE